MRHVLPLIVSGATLLIPLASSAAQDTQAALAPSTNTPEERVHQLNRITVTATRSPQRVFDLPGMATVVNAMDDPSLQGASTLKDVMRDVPGLEFTGSGRRNGQNMVMRGFDTRSIVVLFDGVRQRGEAAHDGQFFVDPSLLKQVDVVRGPNSTLYGSGGLGGVVSFTTKDAADLLGSGEKAGALSTLGGGSVNDEWWFSQSAFIQKDNNDVLVNLTRRESGDIRLGDGSTLTSRDRVTSGLLKWNQRLGEFSSVSLNAQLFRNDAVEPNNPQTLSNADLANKTITSWQSSVEYRYNNPEQSWLELTARVYFTDSDIRQNDIQTGRNLDRRMDRAGVLVENQSRFAQASGLTHTLTYGVEYYTEGQVGRDTRTATGLSGSIPDADYDYTGVYLQDEMTIPAGPLPGDFLAVVGARFDHYRSRNSTGQSFDEEETSPRVGLSYRPADWLMLFGNYATAFRAPNIGEAFTTGVHFVIPGMGSNVFVPNPDLRPERNSTFEYGAGLQFAEIFGNNDVFSIKASRFETKGRDFIDTVVVFTPFPCCGITTADNVPLARLEGYEVEGSYESSRFRLGMGYAVVDGRNQETGAYLVNIMPDTLTMNLGVKLHEMSSVVGSRARFARRHDRVNDVSAERHGYAVFDLYYQWQPTQFDQLSLNLGIDNIFDRSYERVFAGTPEPGRNFNLQMSYRW